MAIVNKLEKIVFDKPGSHSESYGTYAVVCDAEGNQFLQIDTYGSAGRQMKGKKSQSIRFSKEAIDQLKAILQNNF